VKIHNKKFDFYLDENSETLTEKSGISENLLV